MTTSRSSASSTGSCSQVLGSAPFCFKTYLEYLKVLDEKIYRALGRREW